MARKKMIRLSFGDKFELGKLLKNEGGRTYASWEDALEYFEKKLGKQIGLNCLKSTSKELDVTLDIQGKRKYHKKVNVELSEIKSKMEAIGVALHELAKSADREDIVHLIQEEFDINPEDGDSAEIPSLSIIWKDNEKASAL